MQKPETLEGGPAHDGLTLEAGGITVEQLGMSGRIGRIRRRMGRGQGKWAMPDQTGMVDKVDFLAPGKEPPQKTKWMCTIQYTLDLEMEIRSSGK